MGRCHLVNPYEVKAGINICVIHAWEPWVWGTLVLQKECYSPLPFLSPDTLLEFITLTDILHNNMLPSKIRVCWFRRHTLFTSINWVMTADNNISHISTVSCPKDSFWENCKDTNVVCPIMWTYDICAFDTGTYYDYYWQNHADSNDVNETRPSVKLMAINILRYFVIKEVNDSLGIGQRPDLKPLWSKWMDITPLCIHSSLMNCSFKSCSSFL